MKGLRNLRIHRPMEFKQLEAFVAVVENKSFFEMLFAFWQCQIAYEISS